MRLIYSGLMPPKEWEHRSDLKNCDKNTVAMLLAKKRCNIP